MSNHALPAIAGREAEILALVQRNQPVFLPHTTLTLAEMQSALVV